MTAQAERYLGEPAFARLWQAARDAYERNGGLAGRAILADLSHEEAQALNGLLRRPRPLRAGADLRVELVSLDGALRAFAGPLEDWLTRLGGPLASRPLERRMADEQEAALWLELIHQCAGDERLQAFVADVRASGLLKRLARGNELETGRAALNVLAWLHGSGGEPIDLAVLGAELCGDAKALGDGRPLGTLVLRGLALAGGEQTPASAAARRELFERYGVVCDTLSSHVLFLNLPVEPSNPIGVAIAAHAAAGEPQRLTLRALRRFPLRFQVGPIYVCENPTIVSAAAEAHGAGSAPLVCTDGRAAIAVARLLEQAAAQGCELRYHGDFDWPGVELAADAIHRYAARPWRLGAEDYERRAPASGKELKGGMRETPWDPALVLAMERHGVVVEEEAVIADLLADLGA